MLPSLANADDLEEWAKRLEARGYLPDLVRRLILASTKDLQRIEMRTGKGTGYPGYDGIVTTKDGNAFVPEGLSVWEMGVNQRPSSKAQKDYATRSSDPLDINPQEAVYIFVTPRRWAGKNAWIKQIRQKSLWRDVRVIDADDIELWFGLTLSVHVWFSQLIGKNPTDLYPLDAFWRDWRDATQPPISQQLVISGRVQESDRIIRYINNPPIAASIIRADSSKEACAFIAATVDRLPETEAEALFTRTLLAKTEHGWNQGIIADQPLVLIPLVLSVNVTEALRHGHHVLIPTGPEIVETDDVQILPRPKLQAVENALKEMGIDGDRLLSLAQIGRRSLLSLYRIFSLNPAIHQPTWASSTQAHNIIVTVFANSWDESMEGDCNVIAGLAGLPYEEVIERLHQYLHISDAPFHYAGTIWTLSSKEDAWRLLARHVRKTDIERLRDVMFTVLGSLDPALELPIDRQWMANALGHSRLYSPGLREGLADTLAFIAERVGHKILTGNLTGQGFAETVAHHLLDLANTDLTGRTWKSLADILPLLAEGAPITFLNAVESACLGEDPLILTLFSDDDGSALTTPSWHHWLIWALEQLVWSPSYMTRAVLTLGKLSRLDPGGRNGNRPASSLRNIFLMWYPQISATHEQRLQIIDLLREQEPEVAWKLMLSIIPSIHDSTSQINTPKWREWQSEEYQRQPTGAELWNSMEAVVARLLQDSHARIDCLSDLINLLDSLPSPLRAIIFNALESIDLSEIDDPQDLLWIQIRECISKHRRHAYARWAMPAEDVDRLEKIYSQLTPTDPIRQIAWIIAENPPLLEIQKPLVDEHHEVDLQSYNTSVMQLQITTIKQFYQEHSISGLFRLCEAVVDPYLLGVLVGKHKIAVPEEDQVLTLLGSDDIHLRNLARGYVVGRFQEDLWEWADRLITGSIVIFEPQQRADLFLCLSRNSETWDRLDREIEVVIRLYWAQIIAFVENSSDSMRAVDQLLKYGHPWKALVVLAHYIDKISPSIESVLNVLEAASLAPLETDVNHSLQYDVGLLLDYVSSQDSANIERLARIEWAFIPLFRYQSRTFKALHTFMADDPRFFVELVSLMYRADDEEPREINEMTQLRARAAHDLLESAMIIPGTQDDGVIDDAELLKWVMETRQLFAESKRIAIGDICIGQLLRAYSGNMVR
jgi:hypothetical protein